MLASVKPLAVFVRDVVAPTLRKHGFRRSHGTFRVVTDKGVAVIEVSGRGGIGRHDLDFDVGVGFTTHEDRAVFRASQESAPRRCGSLSATAHGTRASATRV